MSGHTPWRRLRDAHLSSSPEAQERYAKARRKLERQIAESWQCPHCRDWFLPDDELGSPPVCDMCKLGRRIADEHREES